MYHRYQRMTTLDTYLHIKGGSEDEHSTMKYVSDVIKVTTTTDRFMHAMRQQISRLRLI